MSKYVLSVKLKQQTPLIHFQHDQAGATLRASEVKPKLDKFLIKELGGEVEARKAHKEWFLGDHPALNYKMKIKAENNSKVKEIPYQLFYANMGDDRKKNPLQMIIGDSIIEILSFDGDLLEYIKGKIYMFFIATTFGMMSGKGFGGYVPDGFIGDAKKISDALKKVVSATKVYQIKTPLKVIVDKTYEIDNNGRPKTRVPSNIFDNLIKPFHQLMKSGINFNGYERSYLFQYFHEKYNKKEIGYGNDKACVKQKGIAPIAYKVDHEKFGEHKRSYSEWKYVRGLLGTTSKIEYNNKIAPDGKPDRDEGKTVVSIDNISDVERFSSPIQYRIIANTLYIFSVPIPDVVFGAEFEFSSAKKENKYNIPIPLKDEFCLEDFLSSYIDYININKNARGVAKFNSEKFIEVI
jgi:hypothetical protein